MQLANLTLGLRGLQIILALAVLGLSASLVRERICWTYEKHRYCSSFLESAWDDESGFRTTRYSTFLGIYGALTGAIGLASLFLDVIPALAALVADCIGAMLHLAGGIAWVAELSKSRRSCGDIEGFYSKGDPYSDIVDALVSSCRRCEADHGLLWALFAFTTCLALCGWLRRRDQVQSSR